MKKIILRSAGLIAFTCFLSVSASAQLPDPGGDPDQIFDTDEVAAAQIEIILPGIRNPRRDVQYPIASPNNPDPFNGYILQFMPGGIGSEVSDNVPAGMISYQRAVKSKNIF